MKRSIAVMLALLLLLFACDGESGALEGSFQGGIQWKDRINASLAEAGVGAYVQVESFALPLRITFFPDGRYEKSVDVAAVEELIDHTRGLIRSGLETMAAEKAAAAGLDLDAFLDLVELDLDAVADAALNGEAVRQFALSMQGEGRYLARNGRLYLSAAPDRAVDETVYDDYELKEDALTLSAPAGPGRAGEADLYPIVLKRIW